jgi:ABC-2 type transport system permease protein
VRLLRAELFKLRTTPGPWVVLGVTLLLTGLGVLRPFLFPRTPHHLQFLAPTTTLRLRELVGSGLTVGAEYMAAILGILCVTGEFRHKVITTTLLATPRRWRLVVAKSVASIVWSVYYCIASLAMVAALGIPLLVTQGGSTTALWHQVRPVVPGLFGSFALIALFGVGFGTLVRNQIAAVVAVLAISFIIEPIVIGVSPEVGRWLPAAAAAAVSGDLVRGALHAYLLSWWLGAIVLAAWGVVPVVVGYFTTFSRDVT